ncbi:MAG: redox-sensitive transcriptional activator SoxR [Chloroflexi bacterium]|nr:redox-sensitive transcriptional activator SoxR [Chloroflexota bacterium]
MPSPASYLTVGELAARSGVQTSALRFYESQGLISSRRTNGNQRRYAREMLRRVAFIRAARVIGLSLKEIIAALGELPETRTPKLDDWERLSSTWRAVLDDRISELERLRSNLNGCIGCGCLSLESCGLFNSGDVMGARGPGARRLVEATPPR